MSQLPLPKTIAELSNWLLQFKNQDAPIRFSSYSHKIEFEVYFEEDDEE